MWRCLPSEPRDKETIKPINIFIMKTDKNMRSLATPPQGAGVEYQTPEIEVVSIATEKGFAVSLTSDETPVIDRPWNDYSNEGWE